MSVSTDIRGINKVLILLKPKVSLQIPETNAEIDVVNVKPSLLFPFTWLPKVVQGQLQIHALPLGIYGKPRCQIQAKHLLFYPTWPNPFCRIELGELRNIVTHVADPVSFCRV